jgi:hypothetical protein
VLLFLCAVRGDRKAWRQGAGKEFEQRHQALLDLIVARTGLLPRTLDKKLVDAASSL